MSGEVTPPAAGDTEVIGSLEASFAAHKRAFADHPFPDLRQRRADLYALADAILANRRQIREALRSDFGAHADAQTDLIEVAGPVARATAAAKEVKHWMEPERRPVERLSFGTSKAMVAWQPKGVVGIIVPWNFPIDLSLGPLADNLAAGNRVIIKMSEFTPACGALVAEIVARTFAPDHVTVVNGGVELGRRFATLRWDHLLFTGNPEVGRSVAVAAAQNLVPVTLELGGKNPAIFADDIFADEEVLLGHMRRMLGVKLVKSGQMCISVDHCLVPRARMEDFVRAAQRVFTGDLRHYSRSDSCTGIISSRHFDRQLAMLEEARTSGARVVQLDPAGAVDEATRRLPAALVIDPRPGTALMNEEVFGPLLPVIPYDSMDTVLHDLAHGERPLALYVFTNDEKLASKLQRETISGGFCVNAAAAQGGLHTLGFGGVGRSGYGRHHGHDGFKEFSNPRGTFVYGRGGGVETFLPPYTADKRKQIEQLFGLRRVQLRVAKTLKPGRDRR